MNKLQLIKVAAQLLASLGVQKILADVIRNNVSMVTNIDKVLTVSGGLALGSIATDVVYKHVENVVDQVVDGLEKRSAPTE